MRNALLAGIAVAACAALAGCSGDKAAPAQKTLLVYCGGTMRPPMEAVAKAYKEKTGVQVDLSFGDSGELMAQGEMAGIGDGMVVHDPFAQMAEARGIVVETKTLATMLPAVGVKKGTKGEQEVKDLADLAKPGLQIGVPDPVHATCGNILAAMLKKADLADGVMKNAVLQARSSGDLVNALSLGKVDAVVAWDAVLRRDANLALVPVDDKYKVDAVTSATKKDYPIKVTHITLSSLKSSKDPAAMKAFLDYASGQEGRAAFTKLGFDPAD